MDPAGLSNWIHLGLARSYWIHLDPYGPRNPPTSLSVERVRTRHQPASPSATNLTPLNSLRSSAIQPASTPNLVAASLQVRWLVAGSLQARWLAYCPPKGFELRCDRAPQGATGCHRTSDSLASTPSQTSMNPPKSNQNLSLIHI